MHIVSAQFVEEFRLRPGAQPTRIDITGVLFSIVAPEPVPVTVAEHLLALIFCPLDEPGDGVFEVVVRRGLEPDSEEVARNVSPFRVEPGMFTYRLVRAEMEFTDYGQVFAHCRVNRDPWHFVPLTLLPPAG